MKESPVTTIRNRINPTKSSSPKELSQHLENKTIRKRYIKSTIQVKSNSEMPWYITIQIKHQNLTSTQNPNQHKQSLKQFTITHTKNPQIQINAILEKKCK